MHLILIIPVIYHINPIYPINFIYQITTNDDGMELIYQHNL